LVEDAGLRTVQDAPVFWFLLHPDVWSQDQDILSGSTFMRLQITRVVSGLAVALLALANSPDVLATPYVRALTAAYDQNTGYNVQDTGQIAGPMAFAESGPFVDGGSSFHAKAYAQFDSSSGPSLGAYSWVDNTYPLAQAFTPADAWWGDTFTVTGAPGTQITFNVGMQLHDALSAIKYLGYPDNLGAQAVAYLDGTGVFGGLAIHDDSSAPAANKTVWQSVTYNVGTVLGMGGHLSTDATAQGGTATADAFSTALFAIEVVTPGGGYTTESGMVFATSFSVPEPSTYSLLLIGLAAWGLFARCRKQIAA